MVESVKVSPEMKEQKNFLFSISGGTFSKTFSLKGSNLFAHIYKVLSLEIYKVFSAFHNCVLYS